MKRRGKDIKSQRFGKLEAIRPTGESTRTGVLWLCHCDCGGEKEVEAPRLIRGQVKSCGCLARGKRFERENTKVRMVKGTWAKVKSKQDRGLKEAIEYSCARSRRLSQQEEW